MDMSYKIAVASSDGIKIDRSFGAADFFDIYEVEETEYHLLERREYSSQKGLGQKDDAACVLTANSVKEQKDCGTGTGCGSPGRCGSGKGCGASSGSFPKVELVRDCRCIVCEKIGFQIQKQLEKMAITGFDVDCTVEDALEKITTYFQKTDHHQSLRGIRKEN